jgi:sugar/nucleoside kinase (ribokinase family)
MKRKAEDTLRTFWDFCQERHLPQAVLRAIPYVGSSIEAVLYGGETKDLIERIGRQTAQQQKEILSKLEAIMGHVDAWSDGILVVGSGNAEHVLQLDTDLQLGRKHIVTYHEFIGGSGVNYSMRLIGAGYPVFPILSIGKDRLGRAIKQEIVSAAKKARLPEKSLGFIDSDEFLAPNIKTPLSTIAVDRMQRTIFSSQIDGGTCFRDYVEKRMDCLCTELSADVGAAIIGHVQADNPELNPSNPGECTRYVIRSFSGKGLLFANFGNSQICRGARFWEKDLGKLNVFQLNLHEMRMFFGEEDGVTSLSDMVKWFIDRHVTAVVTLDRFGAIGTYRDGRDGVILAWPFELDNYVDSTGAGDAFGAGLVSHLCRSAEFSFTDFFNAIGKARVWAAYACTSLGAATNCPDASTLNEFEEDLLRKHRNPVEIQPMDQLDRLLRIIDKAYS